MPALPAESHAPGEVRKGCLIALGQTATTKQQHVMGDFMDASSKLSASTTDGGKPLYEIRKVTDYWRLFRDHVIVGTFYTKRDASLEMATQKRMDKRAK